MKVNNSSFRFCFSNENSSACHVVVTLEVTAVTDYITLWPVWHLRTHVL